MITSIRIRFDQNTMSLYSLGVFNEVDDGECGTTLAEGDALQGLEVLEHALCPLYKGNVGRCADGCRWYRRGWCFLGA